MGFAPGRHYYTTEKKNNIVSHDSNKNEWLKERKKAKRTEKFLLKNFRLRIFGRYVKCIHAQGGQNAHGSSAVLVGFEC